LQQFILQRGECNDFVAPPLQIAADMLSRRASSLHRPRLQTELPEFFNRLLAECLARYFLPLFVGHIGGMRYLVKARLKPGKTKALLEAVESGTLGKGSVAGDEYAYNMQQARVTVDGTAHWVETCFCATPLEEERPYWEEYFELLRVKDAHYRKNCRHENGTELWACCDCDCTKKLEERLKTTGEPFLEKLRDTE
jgi:hypothetical protein